MLVTRNHFFDWFTITFGYSIILPILKCKLKLLVKNQRKFQYFIPLVNELLHLFMFVKKKNVIVNNLIKISKQVFGVDFVLI